MEKQIHSDIVDSELVRPKITLIDLPLSPDVRVQCIFRGELNTKTVFRRMREFIDLLEKSLILEEAEKTNEVKDARRNRDLEICKAYEDGEHRPKELGLRFGLSPAGIYRVLELNKIPRVGIPGRQRKNGFEHAPQNGNETHE